MPLTSIPTTHPDPVQVQIREPLSETIPLCTQAVLPNGTAGTDPRCANEALSRLTNRPRLTVELI